MKTLRQKMQKIISIKEIVKEAKEKHQSFLDLKKEELETLNKEVNLQNEGLNVEKIKIADKIISIRGELDLCGDTTSMIKIKEAKQDIVLNCGKGYLEENYYGIKSYSGCGYQGSGHPYCYGPKHGGIVFSVGLHNEFRGKDFTELEFEAVMYYIDNIKAIKNLESN